MAKKKIAALCAVVALAAVAVVGTLAYFTDTDSAKNTFTTGTLDIVLDEAKVDTYTQSTNSYTASNVATRVQANDYSATAKLADVTPGANIYKDPTVYNKGSENAYIAVVVDINNPLAKLQYDDGQGGKYLGVTEIMQGGLADTSKYTWVRDDAKTYGGDYSFKTSDGKYYIVQHVQKDENDAIIGWKLIYYFTAQFATNAQETLFTNIIIPTAWDNDDMAALNGLTMDIKAYAAQAAGSTDVYEALHKAFPSVFK